MRGTRRLRPADAINTEISCTDPLTAMTQTRYDKYFFCLLIVMFVKSVHAG